MMIQTLWSILPAEEISINTNDVVTVLTNQLSHYIISFNGGLNGTLVQVMFLGSFFLVYVRLGDAFFL